MKLTLAEVEHIAALARLKLTDAEKNRFAKQLSDILEYAARLGELDTEKIPPTARVLDAQLPLREDISHPGLPRDEILKNAPKIKEGQFKVPPVFGE